MKETFGFHKDQELASTKEQKNTSLTPFMKASGKPIAETHNMTILITILSGNLECAFLTSKRNLGDNLEKKIGSDGLIFCTIDTIFFSPALET